MSQIYRQKCKRHDTSPSARNTISPPLRVKYTKEGRAIETSEIVVDLNIIIIIYKRMQFIDCTESIPP